MGLTLILGGVRSGKSTRAVYYGRRAGKRRVFFIATARRSDREMIRRIRAHVASRPTTWVTIEEPVNVAARISRIPVGATVIIDCITLMVGKLVGDRVGIPEIVRKAKDICSAGRRRRINLIVVSNEVGSGVHPPTRIGLKFQDALGATNATIASLATRVELMVAGIPVPLKPPGKLRP